MRNIIYAKYSNERDNKFKIKTIISNDNGKKYIEKHPVTKEAEQHVSNMLKNDGILEEKLKNTKFIVNSGIKIDNYVRYNYINGESMDKIIIKSIQNGNNEEAINILNQYYDELSLLSDDEFYETDEFVRVFGKTNIQSSVKGIFPANIDMIFSNIIVNENGWNIIDCEWCFNFIIPMNFILFRAFVNIGLDLKYLNILYNIDEDEIEIYRQMENHFQEYVLGNSVALWRDISTKGKYKIGNLAYICDENNGLKNMVNRKDNQLKDVKAISMMFDLAYDNISSEIEKLHSICNNKINDIEINNAFIDIEESENDIYVLNNKLKNIVQ